MREEKIIQLFTPGPLGGAEKVLIRGLEFFKKRNIKTELWLIKENRVPEHCDKFLSYIDNLNISYKVIETNSTFDFTTIKKIKKLIKKNNIDLIHAHGIKASFYGKLASRGHSKFITTHHGNTSHTLKVKVYEYLEKLVMKNSDQTIAVSKPMHDDLVASGLKRVSLVENLLSFDVQTRTSPNNKILKFIIVGRLSPEKGHLDLLKALTNIQYNYHLNIIGDGNCETEILDFININNMSKNVSLLGFSDNIKELMSCADALLMPSHREGLPMTLIEAICIGLPVIGSNIGGLSYLVSDNGLLFTPQNINEITEKLIEFNDQRSTFLKVACEHSIKFQNRFHPENWVKNTVEVYKKVLSQV
jgi:glycosyltransferase involved in cell wall biosynthesis